MKNFALFFIVALLSVSCTVKQQNTKQGSSGKTLEMLLVSDNTVYSGSSKRLIDSIFAVPQQGLPQVEPILDVVHIPISSFKNTNMFRVHRNVFIGDISAGNPNKVYKHIDKWSAPQVVFEVLANSRTSFDSLLRYYAPTIIKGIYDADHRRVIKAYSGMAGIEVMNAIKKQFGFNLTFSDEFELAHPANPSADFAWVRKEAKDFGMGVLIHVCDYQSQDDFAQKVILDKLDTIMFQHVSGPAEDSYMATERRVDCSSKVLAFCDSPYAVETRGCWRLFGDFMGGPFVNYTLLTPDKKQVVYLTAYVYCPRFDKRDYLMQIESVCWSLNF